MKRVIDLYKIGERIAFNNTRELTKGARSEGMLTLAARSGGPLTHVHIGQTESFEVISGKLLVIMDNKEHVINAGQTITIPNNVVHTFKNANANEPVEAKFWFEPALNAEWMLQTLGESAMDNGGDWAKASLLQMGYLMYLLRREYRLGGLPNWLQDVIFGLLYRLAIITGEAKKIKLPAGL